MQHPFLSKEALREGAAIFSGGEDVQPPPGSEPALQCAVSSAESVPGEEATEAGAAPATDDEEDGELQRPPEVTNPSTKKRTMEEEAMRTTNLLLAREYIGMLKNSGSADPPKTGVPHIPRPTFTTRDHSTNTARPLPGCPFGGCDGSDCARLPAGPLLQEREGDCREQRRGRHQDAAAQVGQGLVRSPSLFEIVTILQHSCHIDVVLRLAREHRASEYALYKFQNENERLVTPGTKVLEVMKQHNVANGPLIWIFKEMPDTEVHPPTFPWSTPAHSRCGPRAQAFGDLAEVLPRLQADGISLFTNKDAVDGLIKVLLKSRLSLVSALFSVAKRQGKKYALRPVDHRENSFGHILTTRRLWAGGRRSWSAL